MSIGSRIREFRTKRGFTQIQMAEKLGMTEQNFSSYERDKSIPPGKRLNQIASILNVSVDYLYGNTNDPSPHLVKEDPAPYWATAKDKRDFKKLLEEDGEIMFDGVPISEDDKEKLKRVMEAMFWDAKKKNKRKPIDD